MATLRTYDINEARKLVKIFAKAFKGGACHFSIQQPCALSIALKDGGYRSIRFIGEEPLIGLGAYVGKTGKLILTFACDNPVPRGGNVEIELTKATAVLGAEFSTFADMLIAGLDQEYMGDVRFGVDEMETTASADATRDRYKEDPLFGSW